MAIYNKFKGTHRHRFNQAPEPQAVIPVLTPTGFRVGTCHPIPPPKPVQEGEILLPANTEQVPILPTTSILKKSENAFLY